MHKSLYYYNLLKARRKTIKKVLEIGIGTGASLRMWRDFFPNAKIYGADYRDSSLLRQDRIESFLCDQRRGDHLINLINKTGSDIDLVIDDASHRSRDQIYTCSTLMPLLDKRVTYIIEDVTDVNILGQLGKYNCKILTFGNGDKLVVVKNKTRINTYE